MIVYVNSSVLLAELLAEQRRPPSALWQDALLSSRLLEYEVRNRLHALGAGNSHGPAADNLIRRLDLIELSPVVLERALRPFPAMVRTLDALHLASALYMHQWRDPMHLATYDKRLVAAAIAVDLPLYSPPP